MLPYFIEVFEAGLKRKFNLPIKPRFINFLLTYKCDSRCKMCNIWNIYNQDPQKSTEELTIEEIEKFLTINNAFLSRLVQVGFTGGEPLLMRDDFVDIVRLFRTYLPNAGLGVQTNGLNPELARKKLEEITSFYPAFSLAVSIDGIGETHNKLRGIDGAFDMAVQTINYAKELGIKRISCGMILTPYNYKEIIQVKELAGKLGCEFSCFLFEIANYFYNISGLNNYSFGNSQKKEIIRQLKQISSYHYFMDNLRLLLEGKRNARVPCFSGFTSLVIDPYGDVKPCILNVKGVEDDTFGNIKDEKLESVLKTKKALEIKKKIKDCSCWCQCEVSSSAVFYPVDVIRWFLFYCGDRIGFLKNNLKPALKRVIMK